MEEVKQYRRVVNKKRVAIAFLILLACIIFFNMSIYKFAISPVSRDSKEVIVTIDTGGVNSVSKTLKDNHLIRSTFMFKVYVFIHNTKNLQAATYKLNQNMGVKEIIQVLNDGKAYDKDSVSITFKEGINVRKIAKLISEKTSNTEDQVYSLMNDEAYLNEMINKYWFLTEVIKNKNIYYPLEGYLFPDTYIFKKDVTVREIFDKMLNEMDGKLSKYRDQINSSNTSIHELMTLASMVELEASNKSDRKDVAGVFINRLNSKWSLGSDVTAYYGAKIDDFSAKISSSQLTECNNYNTRCTKQNGLPIGPIAIVSEESIEATLNYSKHDFYYFVADCKGKTYLNKTESEQNKTITNLKKDDNWCA